MKIWVEYDFEETVPTGERFVYVANNNNVDCAVEQVEIKSPNLELKNNLVALEYMATKSNGDVWVKLPNGKVCLIPIECAGNIMD